MRRNKADRYVGSVIETDKNVGSSWHAFRAWSPSLNPALARRLLGR